MAVLAAFFVGTLTSGPLANAAQSDELIAIFLDLVIDIETQIIALQTEVSQLELAEGPEGPEGPAGPTGEDGAQGPTMNFYTTKTVIGISQSGTLFLEFSCDPGDHVIDLRFNPQVEVKILRTEIIDDGNTYFVGLVRDPQTTVEVALICADTNPG